MRPDQPFDATAEEVQECPACGYVDGRCMPSFTKARPDGTKPPPDEVLVTHWIERPLEKRCETCGAVQVEVIPIPPPSQAAQ